MNNNIFNKIWTDESLLEMKISAYSEYVNAYQNCYIEDKVLVSIAEEMKEYVINYTKELYLEFGNKEGNYTPAFSMYLFPADTRGHLKIEVDIEIADDDTRLHRCKFFVEGEIGAIEKLAEELKRMLSWKTKMKLLLKMKYLKQLNGMIRL